jgi:predicted anti-sigma-YlaC factor YlaD
MNHQPFRGWLLADEDLTVEQSKALQEHLRECEDCRRLETSWKELEAVIDRSALLAPASGFVERWQIRLVEHQQHQQKLRGWYMIGATSLVVVFLLGLALAQLWSLINAPNVYLAAMFDRLMGVVTIYFTIQNVASSIHIPAPLYSLAAMVFLSGMISFMSVLWLATYRKISLARRQA